MTGDAIRQPLTDSRDRWPWRLWFKWIWANALAELLGLGTSVLLWMLFFLGMEESLGTLWSAIIVVVGSTILDGSAVGITQWYVLRQRLPNLPLRVWWIATALGALAAWTLGMIPSTMMALNAESTPTATTPDISDALVYLLAAVMGLTLGPILALPQWWVLRKHVAHAWQWIPANALAWALGMPIIFMMVGLTPGETFWVQTILLVLAGLALAGAVVGATHGAILMRLLSKSSINGVTN